MVHIASTSAMKAAVREKDLNLLDYVVTLDDDKQLHRPCPSKISLVPLPSSIATSRQYQLFLDEVPIPSRMFKYDPHDRKLSWSHVFGGGYISFYRDGMIGAGTLGSGADMTSFGVGATASFMCDTALEVGATYIFDGKNQIGINWDPNATEWKKAEWKKDALKLSYTVKNQGPILPPDYDFTFRNMEAKKDRTFHIDGGTGDASVAAGSRGSQMGWDVYFKNTDVDFMASAYEFPSQLHAFENLFASKIDGAFCVDEEHRGDIYGLNGDRDGIRMCGYFRTTPEAVPFAIFSGELKVDGKSPANVISYVRGNKLHWQGLSLDLQQKLGLPAQGILHFATDGNIAECESHNLIVSRLSTPEILEAMQTHSKLFSGMSQSLNSTTFSSLFSATSNLTINGLLPMTPFEKNKEGEWYDAVQQKAVDDMWKIVNSYVPKDLWKKLFGGVSQPTLSGYLDTIARTPVQDENGNILDPEDYYKSLSTLVLCISLENSNSENAKLINAPRAHRRFQEETSSSPIYERHTQMLFEHHWKAKHKTTKDYLDDQYRNASAYESEIDNETIRQIELIDEFVYEEPGGTVKEELRNYVRNAAKYAKSKKLYWAFGYYTYNTHPNLLATFMWALSQVGNGDATELMRLLQSGICVLTALDASGFFAELYVDSLNSFFGSTLLLSLIDYAEDSMDVSIVRQYMEEFVKQCENSGDNDLMEAAKDIQDILDAENQEEMIEDSMNMLRRLGGAKYGIYGNRKVINDFFENFYKKYEVQFGKIDTLRIAETFSRVLTMVVGGAQIYMLVFGFQNFEDLNEWQKAQLLTATTRMVVQSVYSGVRGALSLAEQFTPKQLPGAVKISALWKADEKGFYNAMKRVGTTIRAIADNISHIMAKFASNTAKALLRITDEKMLNKTIKSIGKNMDRFVGPALGGLFEIAGIVFDIAGIVRGDSGLMLAADITGLIAGGLTIFAIVGGFFGAEAAIAPFVAIAGPLGTVFALVSLGLAIAALFSKPPDPIKQFIDDYVKPAKLSVTSEKNGVEYLLIYTSSSKGYQLVGCTLTPPNSDDQLCAKLDTSLVLGSNDDSSNYVMLLITTNGNGESEIKTAVGNETDGYSSYAKMALKDDVLCFTAMDGYGEGNPESSSISSLWKITPVRKPELEGEHVFQLFVNIELVGATHSKKYLQGSNGNVTLGASKAEWTMTMAGLKPQDMSVETVHYTANVDLTPAQTIVPQFTHAPSLNTDYSVRPSLPSFLSFDSTSGIATPNGTQASAGTTSHTMEASNELGKGEANFQVVVEEME